MLCGLLPFKRLNAFPVHSLTFGVVILVHWRLNCLYSWWLENMNAHAVHVSPCRSDYWVIWWFYSSRCEELMLFSLEAASFYHPSTWVESSNFSEARPALFGVLGSSPAGPLAFLCWRVRWALTFAFAYPPGGERSAPPLFVPCLLLPRVVFVAHLHPGAYSLTSSDTRIVFLCVGVAFGGHAPTPSFCNVYGYFPACMFVYHGWPGAYRS